MSPAFVVFKVLIIMFVGEHHQKNVTASGPISRAWALGDG